jgi:hypothetical protein
LRRNGPITVYVEAHDDDDDDDDDDKKGIVASKVVCRDLARGAHFHMKHINRIAMKFIYRN